MAILKVYIASKVHHAEKWRRIRAENSWGVGVKIISRWIDEEDLNTTDTAYLASAWERNMKDIMLSNVMVVYAGIGDTALRGALIEAGAGLSWELPIIACGSGVENPVDEIFGSWQFHPSVYRVKQEYDIPFQLSKILEFKTRG